MSYEKERELLKHMKENGFDNSQFFVTNFGVGAKWSRDGATPTYIVGSSLEELRNQIDDIIGSRIKVGSVVTTIEKGNPSMTVEYIDVWSPGQLLNENVIRCIWFDGADRLCRESFKRSELQIVDKPRVPWFEAYENQS